MKHLTLFLLLIIALTACGAQAAQPTPLNAKGTTIATESHLLDQRRGKLVEGDLTPDFSFTLPDGTTRRLSDFRGTPVLLNFWATWCQPCIEEMPTLQQAYTTADGKLVVLAINRNELPDAIASFVPKVGGLTFPLITNSAGDIGDGYGITSLPESYFINRDGTIAARHIGALNATTLQERLGTIK